jgi:carboxypeptidase Taq
MECPTVSDALLQLQDRLVPIVDIERITRVLNWDQQTMMPPAGTNHRAEHLATLRRLSHELLTDRKIGMALDELRSVEESLPYESDDASLIRVTRRSYEKAVRVPAELRAEMTRAAAQARPIWVKAKAESDFGLFLPALERAVELRRRYVECFEEVDEPYDVLLDDFEPYTTTAEVRELFGELKAELVPLIAELREAEVDDSFLTGTFPVEQQERLAKEVVSVFGFRPGSWRLDPTEHPFASGAGIDDVRITTHYDETTMKSFFSTMHEYGHGLYSHQLPRHLERLPTGAACSLGIHESQSRLWENLVGRSRQFWRFFYPRLQQAYADQLRSVDLDRFVAGSTASSHR